MIKKAGITIAISTLICIILNSIFSKFNLFAIRPDMIMALCVTLGILTGSRRSQLICGSCGLLYDIFVCKLIGINCAIYLISGLVSGLFFRKFYSDNIIFPAAISTGLTFFSQNVFALISAISGARFNYAFFLFTYIIPCSIVTAVFTIPLYAILKPKLADYGKFIFDKQSSLI